MTAYIRPCQGARPDADRYTKAGGTPARFASTAPLIESRLFKIQFLICLLSVLIILFSLQLNRSSLHDLAVCSSGGLPPHPAPRCSPYWRERLAASA